MIGSSSVRWLSCALIAVAGSAQASTSVQTWNQALLDSIKADGTPPPRASRAMAMVNTAMYDAVVSIQGGYRTYASNQAAGASWSAEAAANAAAHRVLTTLFPGRAATFDSLLASTQGAIADSAAKTLGTGLGRRTADTILSLRSADGSTNSVSYPGGNGVGQWRPTPSGFAPAALPQWANVTPWAMNTPSQFRAPAPPDVNSAEYTAAYNEVKAFGALNSAVRTADQSEIAVYWAANAGTVTPPGQFLEIGLQLAASRNLSLLETARLGALMGIAAADAGISAWDTKYTYGYWRPVTGINEGENDGNADTAGDAAWVPFLSTPNHPSYTSGHSTFSGTISTVIADFFGTDDIAFSYTNDTLGITRSFLSLSEAADEAGQSRIYGGIHWQFDNQAGLAAGRALGEYISGTQLLVPAPGVMAVAAGVGLMAARRRR